MNMHPANCAGRNENFVYVVSKGNNITVGHYHLYDPDAISRRFASGDEASQMALRPMFGALRVVKYNV